MGNGAHATPNPGSEEARAIGCRCPVLDNGHGRGSGPFWVREDCPVHTPPPARGEERDPVRRAFEEIGRICEERWAGREGWRTSIPARPGYDSDLILADGLKVAEQRLSAAFARLTATEARLAEAEIERDRRIAWDEFCDITERHNKLVVRLAALTQERDEAVAMCRDYVQLLESGDCGNGPKYARDIAARLAKIGGEDV